MERSQARSSSCCDHLTVGVPEAKKKSTRRSIPKKKKEESRSSVELEMCTAFITEGRSMRDVATHFPNLYVYNHVGLWELHRILVTPDKRDVAVYNKEEKQDDHEIFTNQMKEFQFI